MGDGRPEDPARRAADLVVARKKLEFSARLKCGITTSIAIRETASPASATAAPGTRRPRAIAYQMPRPATTNAISSLVVAASSAHAANGISLSSSRNQIAKSSSGQASATGWNSFNVSHCVGG